MWEKMIQVIWFQHGSRIKIKINNFQKIKIIKIKIGAIIFKDKRGNLRKEMLIHKKTGGTSIVEDHKITKIN